MEALLDSRIDTAVCYEGVSGKGSAFVIQGIEVSRTTLAISLLVIVVALGWGLWGIHGYTLVVGWIDEVRRLTVETESIEVYCRTLVDVGEFTGGVLEIIPVFEVTESALLALVAGQATIRAVGVS